jgi:GDPmannose 4,6-dehydratase
MWLILQHTDPDDFVIATGQSYSVKEFVGAAFREVGIDIVWEGSGIEEKGVDSKSGKTMVEVDPRYFRPTEVESLQGDASKAKRLLGWEPRVEFPDLVKRMVAADLKEAEKEHLCNIAGFE